MTYYEIMPSTKSRYNSENELIFERGKKKIYRGFQSLLWEITENYRRVSALLASVWVLCSSGICTIQYVIQEYLWVLEENLKRCESDIIYEPTYSTRLSKYFSLFPSNNKIKEHKECMCNKSVTKAELPELRRNANVVTSWLRRKGIRVSFSDVTQWNDGTLMWKILRRISIRKCLITDLDASKRLENWTLLGTVIKHRYPGLIQNEILLRCLASSDPVCVHHVIYILTRMMNAHRRTWKGNVIKLILDTANVFKRFLSPRFLVNGPGIIHAKVNLKNEFIIRTEYVCPPFTIEVEDASGEIWRENSNNAKLNNRHDEEYTSACVTECEKPVEIVRVTRFLYRIFFIVRSEGKCRISVRPGINKGGHIHGSPFIVDTNSAVIQRSTIVENDEVDEITPTSRINSQTTPRKRLTGQSVISENGMENTHENTNGHAVRDVDDIKLSEDSAHLTPSSRFGLRKMTVAILRQISTGITTVSHRVVSTIRKSSCDADSGTPRSSSVKRKTHVSVFARPSASNVRKGGSGLNMPSSRSFKIRSVTVHKYLNKPMPSLEEYFLGQGGFSVESESGVGDAGKRWSTISSLLRAKMRMMSRIERPNTFKNRRVSESLGLQKRRPQLRRSPNVYESRRLRSRHSSDDVFWRKGTRTPSSSSSEDDRDVFDDITEDDDFRTPTEVTGDPVSKGEMPRQRKYPVSDDGARFHQLFRDEGGAADLLLQNGVTSSNSRRHNHKPLSPTYESKHRHSSDRRISYSALCKEPKARRSGYSMCRPDSLESQPEETNNNTIERTCAEFAEKTAINVMKMAGDDYVKNKFILKEHKR